MATQEVIAMINSRPAPLTNTSMKKRSSLPDISDLVRSVKQRDTTEMLPSATKKKIWGSLTVHDIALNKQEFPSLKNDTGCPGYRVPNPDLRFNFGSRPLKLSGARNKNFLDNMIQVKKIIPGPGAYVRPDNWAKMGKPLQIYTKNRSSFMNDIIKSAKATPGIGKYDN
jgi:hypothetical protein